MQKILHYTFASLVVGLAGAQEYPAAPRGEVVDVHHGVEVPDPYRWLEDLESDASRAFLRAQDDLMHELAARTSGRDALRAAVPRARTFAGRSTPVTKGGREFQQLTAAGARFGKVYVREDGAERLLLDQAEVVGEGESFGGWTASEQGRYLSFQLAPSGPAWSHMRILDVTSGELLDDRIDDLWGSASWTHDDVGFFYARFPPRDPDHPDADIGVPSIWYHRVGTTQAEDERVFALEEGRRGLVRKRLTRDGRYLLILVSAGSDFSGLDDEVWVRDLSDPESTLEVLLPLADGRYGFEGNDGSTFWFRTTVDAPNRRLIAVDLERPEPAHWRTIVPERGEPLEGVSVFQDRFALFHLDGGLKVASVVDREGNFERLLLPEEPGALGGLSDDPWGTKATFGPNRMYEPAAQYELDVATGETRLIWRAELPFDPEQFTSMRVHYRAADGTRVPLQLVGRRDVLASREPAPVMMYAYGAMGWAAFPWFQPHVMPWLEAGGLYAVAGVRGGGEYGQEWQDAGKRRNKSVGISDMAAAAEFLIEARFTTADQLVANGGSASGCLAAAVMHARPELFAAALIEVPKLDMLRYHLFTGSSYVIPDFGTAEDPDDFVALHGYSPLQNVEPDRDYPLTIVVVGEDDRTAHPFHGTKYIAELQARAQGGPFLLATMWGVGHGYGALSDEDFGACYGDVMALLFDAVGMEPR